MDSEARFFIMVYQAQLSEGNDVKMFRNCSRMTVETFKQLRETTRFDRVAK